MANPDPALESHRPRRKSAPWCAGLMPGNYFAALPVRAPDGWLERLQADAPAGLRWFDPDDLHLTLAFFGKRNEDHIPAILRVLGQIPFAELTVSPGQLLLLPNPRRFSALSLELGDGRDAVARLIADWRPALCEAAAVTPDPRPPLPHLTVARPIRRQLPDHRHKIVAWTGAFAPPPLPLHVHPPLLYGWSPDRPQRQFAPISGAGEPPESSRKNSC